MRALVLLLLAVACAPESAYHDPAPAPAPHPGLRWTEVPTGDSTVIQVDTTQADVGRPHNIIWERTTYPSERTMVTGQGRTFVVKVFLERVKINCKHHESGWIEQTASNAAGMTTFHVEIPEGDFLTGSFVLMSPVAPDSYDELVLGEVCGEPIH